MKRLIILLSLLPLAAFAQVKSDGSFTTVLKGTVIGSDTKALYLDDKFVDLDRDNLDPDYIIPVTADHKFEFTLRGKGVREYHLIYLDDLYTSSHVYCRFFPDQDTVNFILRRNKDNYDLDVIKGGTVNCAMAEYKRQENLVLHIDSLMKARSDLEVNGIYYTVAFNEILTKYNKLVDEDAPAEELNALREIGRKMEREGTAMMPETQALEKMVNENFAKRPAWRLQYIIAHPDLYSYSMFYSHLTQNYNFGRPPLTDKDEIETVDKAYKVLSAAHPDHPYTEKVGTLLSGLKRGVPGGKCLDFTAPDLNGKLHTLSEDISGKIVVIDMQWSSTCSPCRRHSMELIPVFEKYKDKGFTVVGLVHEKDKTDNVKAAVKKDGYPWHFLVEPAKAQIWEKYGAGTGRMFLVDENGTIVFVNPTTEQITEYLDKRYYKN